MHFNNMNHGHNQEGSISRYKKKYKYMKKEIKSLLIENAALCDEVAKIQESIVIVKEERKFLLRKLLEYENSSEIVHPFSKASSNHGALNGSKVKKRKSPEQNGRNIAMT